MADVIQEKRFDAWTLIKRVLFPEWAFNRKVEVLRSGYVFIGLILAVTIAAFNTGNNMLYLVLALMLGGLIASFMASEYMIRMVHVMRDAPGTVTEGVPFFVRYTIRNDKKLIPSAGIVVTERLAGLKLMAVSAYVGAGGQASARALARAERRGRLRFNDAMVSTSLPFGWFDKHKRFPLPGELIALPDPGPERPDLDALVARGEETPTNKKGRSDELLGFRNYTRGDQTKDIHWKTTARAGRLTVREREAETEHRIRIELSVIGPAPDAPDPAREAVVRKAAAVATEAIDRGWLVRIESAGRGIDFGAGSGHLSDILLFLALFDDPLEPAGAQLAPSEVEGTRV